MQDFNGVFALTVDGVKLVKFEIANTNIENRQPLSCVCPHLCYYIQYAPAYPSHCRSAYIYGYEPLDSLPRFLRLNSPLIHNKIMYEQLPIRGKIKVEYSANIDS